MSAKQQILHEISEKNPIFNLIVDTSPIGFTVFDADHRIVYANSMAEKLFGRKDGGLEGLRCGDIIACEYLQETPAERDQLTDGSICPLNRAICKTIRSAKNESNEPAEGGEAFIERHAELSPIWVKYTVTSVVLDGLKTAVLAMDDITASRRKERALSDSAQRFFHMFERAPLGYQSLDENGCFIDVNEAWIETLGYRREEVIGRWFGDFLAPEFVEAFRERFPLFKAEGKIHSEFEMRHRNGDRRHIAFEGRIGLNRDGGFEKTHCILTDITVQKKTEQALQDREHYLQTILQTTVDGFWVVDKSGNIIEVNDAYCKMSGYTRDELLRMNIVDLDREETKGRIEARMRRIIEKGAEIFERRHRRKDGSIFEIEMSVTYLKTGDGQFVCFCRDISDRKRSETALRRHEKQLKEAQEIARLGRWEVDPPTGHLTWSDGIFDLFEVDSDTFAASYDAFLSYVHPDDRDLVNNAYRHSVESKKPYEIQHRLLMKDGRIKWVNEIGRTDYDAQGNPIRSIGTVQEITERKQAEEREHHLANVLRAIRSVNQLIVSEDDPFRLIEKACAELTDTMGYFSAWIALLDEKNRAAVAIAQSGLDIAFDTMRKQLERGEFPACMQRALEVQQTVVLETTKPHCRKCPLHILNEGRSFFSRRLVFNGKTYGIISASLPTANVGDREEQSLFDELADDLSFALHKIEAARQLFESQRDLKRAQALASIGSWHFDLDTGIARASDEGRRIYGLEQSEWSIERVQTIPLPEYREALDVALKRLIRDGAPYDIEFEIRRPSDKAVRHIHSVAEYDADQHVVIGTIQDITEQKRAEGALRNLEARQRKMVANIGDVIVIIDRDGINRYKSPNIEKYFGWHPDEVVGVSTWENVHPEDMPAAQAFFGTLTARPNAEGTTQCRYRCKDGSYKWIEFTGVNLSHDPDIRGILGNYKDITERIRAEERLQQSHNLLSSLARLVPGVIYQYRLYPDGRSAFPYSSPGMRDIYEVTPEQVREDATIVFGRLHPEDHDRVAETILASARTLEMFYCEFRVVLPKQGLRWRWCKAKPQRMDDGGTLWHGIITDITERKQAEEERAELQGRLQQAQKMESVGRLAGGVAHDYNNMLSVILGYTELAMDKVQPHDALYSDLKEILGAAKRSIDITRQLLAFARKQTIAPRVVDLNAMVESMLKMLRRLIGEDIGLAWRPAEALWPVKIDPAQVDQVLANLCVNARDAIGGVGQVVIETDTIVFDEAPGNDHPADIKAGEFVMLAVSDNGSGMDEETAENIFEPFFTTKGMTEGTGLGLATVYGIVKQNGGLIHVDSKPGEGSTFRIYLPRHIVAEKPIQSKGKIQTPKSRGEKVLLAEDESMIMRLTQTMLKRLGYQVLSAATPNEAIELTGRHDGDIDLLLTDVVMPEMNGRQLADRLNELCPGIKTLFMSGYTANVIAHRGVLEEGMNFIQKPFSLHDLGIKMRAVLDDG